MSLLKTADHDHGYMVPDMVPGWDYERSLQFSRLFSRASCGLGKSSI